MWSEFDLLSLDPYRRSLHKPSIRFFGPFEVGDTSPPTWPRGGYVGGLRVTDRLCIVGIFFDQLEPLPKVSLQAKYRIFWPLRSG